MNDKERQKRIKKIREYYSSAKRPTTTQHGYAIERDVTFLLSEIDRLTKERDKWMEEHDKMVAKFANKEEDFRVMREIAIKRVDEEMTGPQSKNNEAIKCIDEEFKKGRQDEIKRKRKVKNGQIK